MALGLLTTTAFEKRYAFARATIPNCSEECLAHPLHFRDDAETARAYDEDSRSASHLFSCFFAEFSTVPHRAASRKRILAGFRGCYIAPSVSGGRFGQ